jgi:hypothetical protein
MTKRGHAAQEVRLKHMFTMLLVKTEIPYYDNAQVMYRYLPKYHVHKMYKLKPLRQHNTPKTDALVQD